MANKILEQKIVDNNNRALIKYVILPDGTATANSILVDASSLSQAMNANNQLMVANTHPRATYRTTIKRIYGNAKANGYYSLKWHGSTNSEIITITSGIFDYNFDAAGLAASIPNNEANPSGDILLSAFNPAAGDAITLFIDLKKDAKDFNAGQLNDPTAFNR
jgi:hypothetical protein